MTLPPMAGVPLAASHAAARRCLAGMAAASGRRSACAARRLHARSQTHVPWSFAITHTRLSLQ
jgi:hypothetical protein